MLPDEDNEHQIALEDGIDALGEGQHGYLMVVSTGNGCKRWLYYVQDPKRWVQELNKRLFDHVRYPLQIEDWPEPEWHLAEICHFGNRELTHADRVSRVRAA